MQAQGALTGPHWKGFTVLVEWKKKTLASGEGLPQSSITACSSSSRIAYGDRATRGYVLDQLSASRDSEKGAVQKQKRAASVTLLIY